MTGVIADDLTGAAELGGAGWRHGLTAELLIEGPVIDEPGVVCFDTDSRSCAPMEAARRAASAAGTLASAKPNWIYKKVDSVLRGSVAAELQAVMERLRTPRTLLVPANPGLGRVIKGGRYFIRGKPIDETDFRHDPEFPRTTSSVRDLLGGSGSLPIHVCTVNEPLPAIGITVGEVQSGEDVAAWAGRWNNSLLAAGGAEFFAALLRTNGHKPTSPAPTSAATGTGGRQLFVCGSASEACERFVAEAGRNGASVFRLAKEWPETAEVSDRAREALAERVSATLGLHSRVVLQLGLPQGVARAVARRLTEELTELAARVVRRGVTRHVYVEGGATGASLVRRLGWNRMKVVSELAPGVVTLSNASGGGCFLTIKPGSYSWPDAVRHSSVYGA